MMNRKFDNFVADLAQLCRDHQVLILEVDAQPFKVVSLIDGDSVWVDFLADGTDEPRDGASAYQVGLDAAKKDGANINLCPYHLNQAERHHWARGLQDGLHIGKAK